MPWRSKFAVSKILQEIECDTELLKFLMKFLPDITEMKKKCDRTFFYTIINSMRPDYVSQILNHSTKEKLKDQTFRVEASKLQ